MLDREDTRVEREGYLWNRPDIVELKGNSRTTLSMTWFRFGGKEDSSQDSLLARYLGAVYFYSAGSDIAYRGYVYLGFGCDVELASCADQDDDTLVVHRSSDGTLERLFVESPDRPFYLERDERNLDLARLVITFVPSAEPRSGSAE